MPTFLFFSADDGLFTARQGSFDPSRSRETDPRCWSSSAFRGFSSSFALFSQGRFDPLPRVARALSLINNGHRPYKYSRNAPPYDRTSHYPQQGLIIYYRGDVMTRNYRTVSRVDVYNAVQLARF